ncbi:MAG: hypothetical protein B9S38_02485 [Verrucomicrobiia bacterium Tous-C4TDCM]|nr:MAG: hypothetical protein B9S38_02485 [Verrucomicrobiae bacterium Tous-C4TDCM]
MPIVKRGRNDEPLVERAGNFLGVDMATEPKQLAPEMLQDAQNVLLRGDGVIRMRPGLAFNSIIPGAIRGQCYYDLPDYEATMVVEGGNIYAVTGSDDNLTASLVGSFGPAGTGTVYFTQMLDRIYWLAGGYLFWAIRVAGVWTVGSVVAFSDATAMPLWGRIATQGFRLLLMEQNGYKLYASAIGQAHVNTDWVKTDNIRVGSGEGDPARMVVAGQAGFVTMLNARSVYQIDISQAAVANWSSLRVTGLVGCVEGKTAVPNGQDVYFLARHGVVSLGALQASDSISPQNTLSAPIQPIIERINWAAIDKAFAVMYREYYLLALPLDVQTSPQQFHVFNTLTRRWSGMWTPVAEWKAYVATLPFGGFTGGLVANFGDKAETIICDDTGRLLRFEVNSTGDRAAAAVVYSVPVSATTRAMTMGAPDELKQPLLAEIDWLSTYSFDGTIALRSEGGPSNTTEVAATVLGVPPSPSDNRQRALLRGKTRGRSFAIVLTAPSGVMRCRGITVHAYADHSVYL